MNQKSQQNQNDRPILTEQFDTLDLTTDEGYRHALTVHTFRCEAEGGCDVEGTADAVIPYVMKNGKKVKGALFGVLQLKAEKTVYKDGVPVIEDGTVLVRERVMLRQILCRKHGEAMLDNRASALKAGFSKMEIFSLPENLEFLRNLGQKKIRRDLAKEFFLAFAMGGKTLEDGMKAGFVSALPPEGEELKPEEKTGCIPQILSVRDRLVGIVSSEHARSYMFVRRENTELFNDAGLYMYYCPLAQAKALAAERAEKTAAWKAKRAQQEADEKKRAEDRAADAAKSRNMFAGFAKMFGLKAPELDAAPKGGDRRKKERGERRDGPKPSKPEVTPEAAAQIAEELEAADTAEVPEESTLEIEEPQGSMASGPLTAPLGVLATSRK